MEPHTFEHDDHAGGAPHADEHLDPAHMSPDAIVAELGEILAAGVRRLRSRPASIAIAGDSSGTCLEPAPPSGLDGARRVVDAGENGERR